MVFEFSPIRARFRFCLVGLLFLVCLDICSALGERPSAMKLFPEETVVFLRTPSAYELGQRIRDTATGRMLRDPQLRPIVEQVYGEMQQWYDESAAERMGVAWDDLKRLPEGEVALGIVAREGNSPSIVLLIDQGPELSVVEGLLERALEAAEASGGEFSTETIEDVEVMVVRDADNQDRMFGIFEHDGTIVIGTDASVLRGILRRWNVPAEAASTGSDTSPSESDADDHDASALSGRSLAENDRFVTIVRNCRRAQDPPPHLLFYVDPIDLIRGTGRDDGGVQFTLGLLPSIGADGLLAIGGALTLALDQYDSLAQVHVLLENPRAGVLLVPEFQPGDTAPPNFVPHAIETYLTCRVDMSVMYDRIAALVDRYRYEGAMDRFVDQRLSQPLGVDFMNEVLGNSAGRLTLLVGYEKPAHFGGQRHILAAEVKDEAAAIDTLGKVIRKYPEVFETRRFGDVEYYAMKAVQDEEASDGVVQATPFVAIVEGCVFLGSSCKLFEQCIAARDGTVNRLIDSKDYRQTMEVLGRETAGKQPVLLSVGRYEETVRQWYDLLLSEQARKLMEEHQEDRLFAALKSALEHHQLPPFEVLAPYLSPSGSILYDTDTGYHGISFTLRDDPAK